MGDSPPSVTLAAPNFGPSTAPLRDSNATNAKRDGIDNRLWVSADSMCMAINRRFLDPDIPLEVFEWDMHDLWHTVYHASMNASEMNPLQEKLTLQILRLREHGALQRRMPDGDIQEATTKDGSIWTDLPYLVQDMTYYWVTECSTMSGSQRLAFTSLLANLAAVGTAGDRLGTVALLLMRDALEMPRALGCSGYQADEDPARTMADMSIAALLPAINTWHFIAGQKLIQFCERGWNDCAASFGGEPGELLQAGAQLQPGFSADRWLYWLRRVEEILRLATEAGDDGLVRIAQGVVDNMTLTADQTDNAVHRAMIAAGRMGCPRPSVPV